MSLQEGMLGDYSVCPFSSFSPSSLYPSSLLSSCAFHMVICLSHGIRRDDLDEGLELNRLRRQREREDGDWQIGEYETLQDLHQWKINHLRADQLELTYSSELELKFNCQAFVPDLGSASISLLSTGKGNGSTGGLFELVQSNLGLILKGKKVSLATVCPFPFFSFFFPLPLLLLLIPLLLLYPVLLLLCPTRIP
jgi:hypothetical protein